VSKRPVIVGTKVIMGLNGLANQVKFIAGTYEDDSDILRHFKLT
jgi:hypothetical protein